MVKLTNTKNQRFAKIPNNFFYNSGEVLDSLGGRNSFLIYCLFTSRKSMCNMVHITLKEIIEIFQFVKNTHRCKAKIIDCLTGLEENGYIKFNYNLKDKRIDDFLTFEWVELYPTYGGDGWVKFYADDFYIHEKIGNIPYLVMWVLRMHENYKTKTSFISITDIAKILQCNRNSVQEAINLFRDTELFTVKEGDYYYHDHYNRKIKRNNEYKYNGSYIF